jgi:hypothetical protein
MRFRRALMALVVSTMVGVIPLPIAYYTVFGVGLLEIDLNAMFFGIWAVMDILPIFCWFAVLVPLLFLTRFFDRWSWYWSGLFGLLIGATGAILYLEVLQPFVPLEVHPLFLWITIWGLNVAIQFMVVSLTKRWAKAAVPGPVETGNSA